MSEFRDYEKSYNAKNNHNWDYFTMSKKKRKCESVIYKFIMWGEVTGLYRYSVSVRQRQREDETNASHKFSSFSFDFIDGLFDAFKKLWKK